MDLVAGLHWLRENIPAFGGDPERITLLGHGTGAALSNVIAVSPVAKGKVQYGMDRNIRHLTPLAFGG
jgi:carboxylesterase type B